MRNRLLGAAALLLLLPALALAQNPIRIMGTDANGKATPIVIGPSGTLLVSLSGATTPDSVCIDAANQDVCFKRIGANTAGFYTGGTTLRWSFNTTALTLTTGYNVIVGSNTLIANDLLSAAKLSGLVPTANLFGGTTPTSSTGFGVTPGVIEAGSSDFGGRVTIGVGNAVTGAITFGGTYTVKPHCVANNETTGVAVQAAATTAVLTLTGTFVAGSTVTWVCR